MTRALGLLVLLAASGAMASGARGQTRLDATVTQIAGSDAYLNRGRNDGLASGDTLRAWREDVYLGRLRVVSAASASAVVTFVAETFAITRGQILDLELPDRAPEPLAPEAEVVPSPPERTSILDTPAARGDGVYVAPVRVSGRVQIGADMLQSSTSFGETETSRQFATPFAALRADVTGLPGGWRASLNGRSQIRTADGAMLDAAPDVWIYNASLDGQVAGADLRMGRFVPRRERFTGAWDGLDLGIGSYALGLGVVAGWRPSRAAGLPDGDRAGTVLYAHAQRGARGGLRLDAAASGGAVWEGEALPFAGGSVSASGVASGVRLRASGDVLADSRPGEAWDVARLSARVSVTPVRALTLRAFARQYRPSVVDGASLVLRFAPSQAVGGGATVLLGPATLRGDLSLRAASGDSDWSRSVSGGASLPRLGGLPLGLDASATVWRRDGREALYASGGVTGRVGGARGTLGYRLTTSPAGDDTLVTHGLDASAHLPLTQRFALSLRGSLASGDGLAQTRLYSALWVRL